MFCTFSNVLILTSFRARGSIPRCGVVLLFFLSLIILILPLVRLNHLWKGAGSSTPLSSVGAKDAESGGKGRQIRRPFHPDCYILRSARPFVFGCPAHPCVSAYLMPYTNRISTFYDLLLLAPYPHTPIPLPRIRYP